MKISLKKWQIIGFVFTAAAGSLLHFVYDFTNQSILAALFSAVNESTWEHMKLLFVPAFIFSLTEYKIIGKNYRNFFCANVTGVIAGLIIIPLLYYTYTGALGVSADWFNIVIFFIAAGVVYYTAYMLLKNNINLCMSEKAAFIVFGIIGLLFVVLTFVQPKIPLFQDSSTGLYGR